MKKIFLRLLQGFIFMLISIGCVAAVLVPFIDPRALYFSAGFCIFIVTYGKEVIIWAAEFMTE